MTPGGMQPIDTRRTGKIPENCPDCLHFPFGGNCTICGRCEERATLFFHLIPHLPLPDMQVYYEV